MVILELELEFTGEGINEVAKVKSCSNPDYQLEIGKEVLSIDEKYFRPTEVDLLVGDPTKAKQKLRLGASNYFRGACRRYDAFRH